MQRPGLWWVAVMIPCLVGGAQAGGFPPCTDVTMTLSAEPQIGGPFDGMWKYSLEGSFDLGGPPALSHMDLLLPGCPCPDLSGEFLFDEPAGQSTGEGGCEFVEYSGIYLCDDPSVEGDEGPLVKWDALDGPCVAGDTGTGVWCFYSPYPPDEPGFHPGIVIKAGSGVCVGDVQGTLPDCTPPVSVDPESWGAVKGQYR